MINQSGLKLITDYLMTDHYLGCSQQTRNFYEAPDVFTIEGRVENCYNALECWTWGRTGFDGEHDSVVGSVSRATRS